MESGSVADWVNAIGTLLAFAGAASAAVIAWSSYRTQRQQISLQIATLEQAEWQRKVEQERAQASKVAFWVGVNPRGPDVAYVNMSGLPIYDILIHVILPDRTLAVEYRALGPTHQEIVLGRVHKNLTQALGDDRNTWGDLLDRDQFLCAVGFRDASDQWWLRDRNGRLTGQENRSTLLESIAAEVAQHQAVP